MASQGTRAAKTVAPSPEAAARVLRQFRLVFNSVKTHFQQVERKVGLGGAQVWALHVIQSNPGIGVNGLAAAMDVRQPTASNLVRALVAQGMVEVRKDGPDRRAVQLHLMKPGALVLPEALSALDAATLARLEADLGALIQVLGADERGAGIPLAQM